MDLKAKIEAILFASGEPLTSSQIAQVLSIKQKETEKALSLLQKELTEEQRGIRLIKKGKEWLLVSAPEASDLVGKLKKETLEGELSPASAETLAIVAYRGPLTRAEISALRGVDATYALRRLLLRGLIERAPHPQRSNTYVYNISFEFLKHLGLNRIEELPRYEEFHQDQQ